MKYPLNAKTYPPPIQVGDTVRQFGAPDNYGVVESISGDYLTIRLAVARTRTVECHKRTVFTSYRSPVSAPSPAPVYKPRGVV